MKVASTVSRYWLGLIFTVLGLNGFLHFLHMPPPPSSLAIKFITAVSVSHYMTVAFLVQLVGGLLLVGRFAPLALTIPGPVLVNVLTFHITMNPGGIVPGAVATVQWFILFLRYRASFTGIFQAHPEAQW